MAATWAQLRAILRALFALSIVTLGALLGALAISGYYEPRLPNVPHQAAVASGANALPPSHLSLGSRSRFVSIEGAEPAALPAKARPPPKPTVAKAKPEAKSRPEPKPKRPRQAAAPWPWSVFEN
jgi:hypothetical protein